MFSACWTPRALPSSVPALMRDLTASCWSWVEIRVRAKVTAGCWSCVQMRVRVLHSTTLCIILDLEQHRCKRTVYGSFLSEDSRCMWSNTASTGLRTGQFVRNRRSTPLPYTSIYGLIRSQDSIMINNPDLKQHRCYGTVYGSNRFIMYYYYDFCLFLRFLHPVTLGIAFI